MIAPKDSIEPQASDTSSIIPSEVEGSGRATNSSDQLPNSRKTYVAGELHPDIRVPFRIAQFFSPQANFPDGRPLPLFEGEPRGGELEVLEHRLVGSNGANLAARPIASNERPTWIAVGTLITERPPHR